MFNPDLRSLLKNLHVSKWRILFLVNSALSLVYYSVISLKKKFASQIEGIATDTADRMWLARSAETALQRQVKYL